MRVTRQIKSRHEMSLFLQKNIHLVAQDIMFPVFYSLEDPAWTKMQLLSRWGI